MVFFVVDTQNDTLVYLLFKMLCLIKEDDEFDSSPLFLMYRRCLTVEDLYEEIEEVKDNVEVDNDLKKYKYLFITRYRHDD